MTSNKYYLNFQKTDDIKFLPTLIEGDFVCYVNGVAQIMGVIEIEGVKGFNFEFIVKDSIVEVVKKISNFEVDDASEDNFWKVFCVVRNFLGRDFNYNKYPVIFNKLSEVGKSDLFIKENMNKIYSLFSKDVDYGFLKLTDKELDALSEIASRNKYQENTGPLLFIKENSGDDYYAFYYDEGKPSLANRVILHNDKVFIGANLKNHKFPKNIVDDTFGSTIKTFFEELGDVDVLNEIFKNEFEWVLGLRRLNVNADSFYIPQNAYSNRLGLVKVLKIVNSNGEEAPLDLSKVEGGYFKVKPSIKKPYLRIDEDGSDVKASIYSVVDDNFLNANAEEMDDAGGVMAEFQITPMKNVGVLRYLFNMSYEDFRKYIPQALDCDVKGYSPLSNIWDMLFVSQDRSYLRSFKAGEDSGLEITKSQTTENLNFNQGTAVRAWLRDENGVYLVIKGVRNDRYDANHLLELVEYSEYLSNSLVLQRYGVATDQKVQKIYHFNEYSGIEEKITALAVIKNFYEGRVKDTSNQVAFVDRHFEYRNFVTFMAEFQNNQLRRIVNNMRDPKIIKNLEFLAGDNLKMEVKEGLKVDLGCIITSSAHCNYRHGHKGEIDYSDNIVFKNIVKPALSNFLVKGYISYVE